MITRTPGGSGIRVSAVGLGAARTGGLGWQLDDRTVSNELGPIDADIRAIHRALDLGINFFDTADVYGSVRSERILGQTLADRRHQAVVATKFGETFDEETRQPTEEELTPTTMMLALRDELGLASINRMPLALGLLGGRWTRSTQLPPAFGANKCPSEPTSRRCFYETDHVCL